MLEPWKLQLCDIQGRLFENSAKAGYSSKQFIKKFMTSSLAKDLDSSYNRMQWAGEEYLLEEFADRCPDTPKEGEPYNNEGQVTCIAIGISLLANPVKTFTSKHLLKP